MSTRFLNDVDFSFLDDKTFWIKVIKVEKALSDLRVYQEVIKYSIPNYELLLAPFSVKESVKSSGIENIFTSTLEVLQGELLPLSKIPKPQKEVINYREALLFGFETLRITKSLDFNLILDIQKIIETDKPGLRNQPGTAIVNAITGKVVHRPPQKLSEITKLINELISFLNFRSDIHPLFLVAICHYQFESIHPFFDGNGRVGRILMVLQLYSSGRISLPILFLSGYILKTRTTYYDLLDQVRSRDNWADWVMYILTSVEKQAVETCNTLDSFLTLEKEVVSLTKLNKTLDKFDHKVLFQKPYISQSEFANLTGVHINSAAKYLNELVDLRVLEFKVIKKQKLYFLTKLIDILA